MGLDHEKIARRRTRSAGGWRPKPGDNKVRILPPGTSYFDDPLTLDDLAISYQVHFLQIEGRPVEVTLCLEMMTPKQTCPACQLWRRFKDATDPALKEMARDVRRTDKYLFNILDHNNLQAGIQIWDSNWTCWDKIMEIAGNPDWGDVIDPENGVDFVVSLAPAKQSRSGYNSYSVTPSPQRTNVLGILEQIENWRDILDGLSSHIQEPKRPEEIVSLLHEMGFPGVGGTPTAPSVAAPSVTVPTPTPGTPPPASIAAVPVDPPATETAIPIAQAVESPPAVAASPQPVVAASPQPAVGPTVTPVAAPIVAQPATVDDGRPEGAPECFGDYDPSKHPCPTCPVIAQCQMKNLGI